MKIEPLYDEIFLEMDKANLGALDTSSVKTGMEWATIVALGEDVKNKKFKVGSKVFVKGWSCDIILYEGKDYIFTREESHGIKAIIK